MNKALIIIAILLVLGVGGYFFYTKSKSVVKETVKEVAEISSGAKSLKDLIASGVPQKCTFSSTEGEFGKTEGTSYVAGGKVRADFTNTTPEKTIVSHMISDGKVSYIWTDGEKNGFKMTVEESSPTGAQTSPSPETSSVRSEADLSQEADYKCSAWVPDLSLFNPPSEVIFTDFSEIFKAATPPPGATEGGSPSGEAAPSACSYCNALSGDEKSQCLSALNCK